MSGAFDYSVESSAKVWATGYESPAKADGRLIQTMIPDHDPAPMQCFAFNIRRDIFKDRRVREALGYAFDFEWSNKTLFYGQYFRTKSFFDNSELAATGLPSPEELKILEPLRGKIPDEVFTKEFKVPVTDGSGNNRANLRQADALLNDAGWIIKDGKRVNKDTGTPLTFEILLDNPLFERLALPFAQSLKRLGIEVSGAHGRRHAIPGPAAEVRLRHDRRRLRRIAFAGQRAALSIGARTLPTRRTAPTSSASRIRRSTA